MAKFKKPIGIVGGAGPVASALFYSTLIQVCQQDYGAKDYADFPEIIIESYPFSRDPEKIEKELSLAFSKLKAAGARIFCVASNSFHGCLPDLSSLEFVHLIEEAIQEIKQKGLKKVLVLASSLTISSDLFQAKGVEFYYPSEEEQMKIQAMIKEIAAGCIIEGQALLLEEIIQGHDVDGVILACTELPVIHRNFPLLEMQALPIIDGVEVLAHQILKKAH